MNNRNMALSLMSNIRTCSAIFVNNSIKLNADRLDQSCKSYTYVYEESMKLQAGDQVVIADARGALKVVTISAIHETVEIDLDAQWDYKAVISKVDIDEHILLEERITKAKKLINVTQQEDTRQKLINTFTGNMSDNARKKLTKGFSGLGIELGKANGEV